MQSNNDLIDVQTLIAEKTVAEHCRLAEEYFAHLPDWNHHLAKPFGASDEAPQLLINFATVVQGLQLCPGMTVLEFGAGTCWAARILTQLGCKVIAVDVSPTALKIGQELYARHPPLGDRPTPQFLLFDGMKLDLPGASVERILCLDAFHHAPNPAQVLAELGRVLEDGGIAGFAEPGPEHSRTPQSQYEMQTYGVIENDIDMKTVWAAASQAGFTDLKLAIFQIAPTLVGLDEFEDFLKGGKTARKYVEDTRAFLSNQRNFFLFKGTTKPKDSRYRQKLTALIKISPASLSARIGEPIRLQAEVTNNSESIWLPRSAGLGAVMLGSHVYYRDGSTFRESYHWEPLSADDNHAVNPGEVVTLGFELPGLLAGQYRIDFDMVSNDVCWFAINGSQIASIQLAVSD
ncbi:MAG TPA: class I SAM-dependent methyltransferase [Pyrinomonadaceae bacterium]|jgi:ubiquinone/menaquinone biosynthesis C-methylase UbiE|nr:class I SAM-dependent methyltransferase [Pyrinomonadaceae bacterium]